MAWIEKREGVNKTSYRVHYKDRYTGKKRNKSFGLRKQAQSFLETVGSRNNAIAHSNANVTVKDALERWYTLCTTTGRDGRPPVEKSTYLKYAHHKNVIIEMIGRKKLCELSKADCNQFRDDLLSRYSRGYAKKFLTSFKAALEQAVTDDLIVKSPAIKTRILISKREVNANRVEIPDLNEVNALIEGIERLMSHNNQQKREAWARYGALFYTMLYTGMRPSEIRGLKWSCIDWDKSRIFVESRADVDGKLGALKSAAGYRAIPIASVVMKKLKTWRYNCPDSQYDLVFPNFKGNVESHANITNRGWYVLCIEAGLSVKDDDGQERPKYRLYSLRHIKASLEIALNRSPKHIQTVMGHANIKMTFDTYGHLFEHGSLQDDPDDMANLLKQGAKWVPDKNQNTEIYE